MTPGEEAPMQSGRILSKADSTRRGDGVVRALLCPKSSERADKAVPAPPARFLVPPSILSASGFWGFTILWLLGCAASAAPPPGADLFTTGPVLRLRIEIAPGELAALRRDSRSYVPAALREGSQVYPKVGIHLKGSTGSFRGLDDKPALTLSFGKFAPGQRFHGLRKIHLNNSVEDPSYLNEALGSELFRSAGVPAPRVMHALVELNGRALGLYVLKEGFTRDFLGLHFQRTHGNLYQPGTGHDVDENLARISGDGPEDLADLKALAAAAQEPDLERRWERLGQTLDLSRFISFMAMEVMTCHRDGYCLARN